MKPVKNEKNCSLEVQRLEAGGSNKVQNCWSRLNASRAAQNSFAGRMFVTSALNGLTNNAVNYTPG